MSEIDEDKIHDRLKRLSQIEPAQDAAERAMQRVRDALTTGEGCRVGLAPPFRIGGLKPTLRFAKLAAAAVLLISAGFLIGRLTGPEPVDVESLRAELEVSLKSSLEPAIRQNVLDEVDKRWQSVFAASSTRLKDELAQQVRRDLAQFAAQSLAASGAQTQQQLKELIQLIEAARIQDRRNVEAALEHIESQFGNGLVTLAAHTNELQRPGQN